VEPSWFSVWNQKNSYAKTMLKSLAAVIPRNKRTAAGNSEKVVLPYCSHSSYLMICGYWGEK